MSLPKLNASLFAAAKRHRLTQARLAKRLGVHINSVALWKRGTRPNERNAKRITSFLRKLTGSAAA